MRSCGRHCGGPLHGGTPDATHGAAWRRAGQGGQDHDRRQGRTLPSGQGEPAVPRAAAERLIAAGIEPSVGSVGAPYDNALAKPVLGLFKTEVIRRRGPWRSLGAVEYATLDWVN